MTFANSTFSLLNKNQKKYLLLIFSLIFITTLLETLSIASFYPLLELIISSQESANEHQIQKIYFDFLDRINISEGKIFNFTITIVGIIFIFKIFALLYCNWHISNFEFSIRYFLTKKLYKNYISLDYSKIIRTNSSEIIKNIDYELSVYSSGLAALMEIITETIILLGIILFLFYFNFKASLIVLIFLSLIGLFLQKTYNKKLLEWGKIHQKYENLRIKNFIETFNAIKEIKIFGKENSFFNLMSGFNKNFFSTARKERFLRSIPRAVLELILIIFACFSLLYFSFDNFKIKENLSSLGIYLIAAYRTFPSANRILTNYQRLKFASPFINNIKDQFEFNKSTYDFKSSENKKINLNERISLQECDFSYHNEKNKILDKLSYDFNFGKIYGIKGQSGGGKTTLLNIITGLLDPDKGSIFVDDVKISNKNKKNLQNIISYVPQNTFLFDSSILNNITFDFSDEEKVNHKKINELVEHLSLQDKILSLKDGLRTNIGERGVNLSGGQIQRIGIARALYNDPKILILDESTNAIEKEIEKKVLNYLNSIKKEMIIILAAHRDTTFELVDEILEIQNGRLIKT